MAGSTSYVGQSYTTQDLEELQRRVDEANKNLLNYNTQTTSDDVLRQRAENEYNPLYNAQVAEQEALKRSAQTARDERLAALARQYEKNEESTNRNYDTQRVTANNSMLGRGMNNSSLALAMLNRVEDQRNRALNDLTSERNAYETSAQNDYNNAVTTADANIARLGSDRAANVDARFQALRDAEQNRAFQAQQAQNQLQQYVTDLMVQIESLRQQGYSQYLQQQNAEAERALQQAQQEFNQQQFKWQQEQAEKDRALDQAKQELAEKEFEWNKQFNQDQFDWQKEQAGKKSSGGGGSSSGSKSTGTSSGTTQKKSGTLTGALSGLLNGLKNKASDALSSFGSALKNASSNATTSAAKKSTSSTTSKKTGSTGSIGSNGGIKKNAMANQLK